MTIEEMQKLYNSEPFMPFDMHLANGNRIRVPSRELFLAPPGARVVAVLQSDDKAYHMVDLLLVNKSTIAENESVA